MTFSRLDIDLRQWRALMQTSFRIMSRQQSTVSLGSQSSLGGLWAGLLMYFIIGVLLAIVANQAQAAGVAAFLLISLIAIFIASAVLLEFGSSIITADDMLILGTRPISSRTYFAARLSTVIIFVLLYATALGGPAVVTFFRFGPLVAVAWIAALLTASLATGLLMVLVYTTALRHVPPARIRSVMGYVQMGLSFLIYGGYGILAGKIGSFFGSAVLPSFAPVLPPAWFAAIVGLAAGELTMANGLGAALVLLSLAVLTAALAGRISLSYTESVLASTTEGPAAPARPGRAGLGLARFLRRPEDRAIALLVLRQFRHDTKFKLSVLAIIPLTIIYIYQGIREGAGLVDPFVSTEGFRSSVFLYIAVILFPVILKNEIIRSDMHQASWIFFASPVRRGELMLSVRNVVTALFVIPYLALLSLVFLYFYRHPGHVLLHMIVLFLATDLFLQFLHITAPQLPFSRPRVVGERISAVTLAMIAGPIFFLGIMAIFTYYLYPSFWTYGAGVAVLAAMDLGLRALLAHRAERAGNRLEYGW